MTVDEVLNGGGRKAKVVIAFLGGIEISGTVVVEELDGGKAAYLEYEHDTVSGLRPAAADPKKKYWFLVDDTVHGARDYNDCRWAEDEPLEFLD